MAVARLAGGLGSLGLLVTGWVEPGSKFRTFSQLYDQLQIKAGALASDVWLLEKQSLCRLKSDRILYLLVKIRTSQAIVS